MRGYGLSEDEAARVDQALHRSTENDPVPSHEGTTESDEINSVLEEAEAAHAALESDLGLDEDNRSIEDELMEQLLADDDANDDWNFDDVSETEDDEGSQEKSSDDELALEDDDLSDLDDEEKKDLVVDK